MNDHGEHEDEEYCNVVTKTNRTTNVNIETILSENDRDYIKDKGQNHSRSAMI